MWLRAEKTWAFWYNPFSVFPQTEKLVAGEKDCKRNPDMEIESAHPVGQEQVELHGNLVEGQTIWSGFQDTWLQVRQLLWESQPFKSSTLYSKKHQRKALWLPNAGEIPPSCMTGNQSPSFQCKGCLADQAVAKARWVRLLGFSALNGKESSLLLCSSKGNSQVTLEARLAVRKRGSIVGNGSLPSFIVLTLLRKQQ